MAALAPLPQATAEDPHLASSVNITANSNQHRPAQTDDGNAWVDGACWLWCGRGRTRVLWLGPVHTGGASAPLYACGPCIQQLHDRVWNYLQNKDRNPERGSAPP